MSKVYKFIDENPWARWSALLLLAASMLFGYIFMDTFSPIQTPLEETGGWDATSYGNFCSSETFLNVFVFFLIIAGIILDKLGVRFTAILSTAVMLVGGLVVYFAMTETFANSELKAFFDNCLNWPRVWYNITPFCKGMPASAKFACFGYMLFGCGVEMGGITVSRGIVKWFQGKEMALAMGIEMAIARIGVTIVFLTSPWLCDLGGIRDLSRPVAFGCFILCLGLVCTIIYAFMDRKLEQQRGDIEEKDDPFKVSDLKYIFTSKVFWIVSMLCVMYYSAIFPFQNYANGLLQSTLNLTEEQASNIFFIFPIGAAIITPFLGRYLDKVGKGATMLIYGSVLMIVCHGLLALVLPATHSKAVAYIAIVILGVSFSLVPASLWPSVPKIVDKKVIGSAYAVIFWIQNIGLYGFRKGIGALLDAVNPGITDVTQKSYVAPMLVFVGCGVVALFFALWLKYLDKKKGYGIEAPNTKS